MKPLLYLVHRLPYPPNKGDKIRSYNILKYLSQYHKIYLGTYIDDPEDFQYQSKVNALCEETYIETINPKIAKLKSLIGFIQGRALSIPYYASNTMQLWVDKVIEENNIENALVFSSPMAQFILNHQSMRKIMDFVDIDSDKWQQYTQSHKGLMNFVYAREAKLLFKYEKEIAQKFDASIFVSKKEAGYFQKLIKQQDSKIKGISNGIDFSYFNPELEFRSPYDSASKVLVFTGAMDYWANCDAVIWFATEIFPVLYAKDQSYRFVIVGSNPSPRVIKLSKQAGIDVTGRVEDVRPYIKYAFLSVAPLRIARGIQNKVLEAMAMNKVVVASNNAMEGIDINDEIAQNVTDTVQGQISCILSLVKNNTEQLGKKSGQWIRQKYHWKTVLEPLKLLIETIPKK